ncbi:MAG: hypothetical protein ABUT39_13325 [Acidobacteriota bacterium]
MATSVKDLTMDDLREMIEQTVRRTLEEYLQDLRLLLPAISRTADLDDPRPPADRPFKPSLDH